MKGFFLLFRMTIALLLSARSISFTHNRVTAHSLCRNGIAANHVLPMKQSNFEDEGEQKSLADIINNPAISIGAGVAGIFVLLANRLSFGDIVSDVQSRADIISVIACSALLLNVLSEQDITARTRDAVPLVGYAMKNPQIQMKAGEVEGALSAQTNALKWTINSILKTTPATSVHVILNNSFLARGGVVGMGDDRVSFDVKNVDKMPILDKTLKLGEEIYLPDLQVRKNK